MDTRLFRGTEPVVLTTDPDDPESGRTFVWAWTEWYERVEGESGDVEFTPVASTEKELNEYLYRKKCPSASELLEVDGEYGNVVKQEFLEQTPLFPEAPELSDEEPFREQKQNDDVEHA